MRIKLLMILYVFVSHIILAETKDVMHVHLTNGSTVSYDTKDVEKISFESKTVDQSKFPVAEEVDLGLSVNWSSWDMGASNTFELGGFYGWGDPTGEKTGFNYDDFPCPFPPSSISGTEYDIATQQWGDGWRIPTTDEFKEMASNCEISTGIVNNVGYIKVTSKINGNSIYFPFAEYAYQNFYWCSNLNEKKTTNAESMYAHEDGSWGKIVDGYERYGKLRIRPIKDRKYSPTSTILEGYESVDLGLPSGTKWATCNVGASIPTNNGCYYSWGEIEEKYPHNPANTKTYGVQMSDIKGQASYDAAAYHWGGHWRMPSKEDAEELVNHCTFTPYSIGDNEGILVTGPNGNQIFLPVTGRWENPNFTSDFLGYWTSTPVNDKYTAYYLEYNKNFSKGRVTSSSRVMGLPIRPVNSDAVNRDPNVYFIGDVYPNESNPEGIVIETDETGKHGKIISFQYSGLISWGPLSDVNATDQTDGTLNQLPTGQLKSWVSSLGNGWYIPARNELKGIARNLKSINSNLSKYGLGQLPDDLYWSSTQHSHTSFDLAYIVCVCETTYLGYSTGWDGYNNKDNKRRALAVKKF